MQISLSNKRLRLREFNSNDWIHVHSYASKEIVCRYQPWGPNTEEDSKVFVQQIISDTIKEPRTRFAFAVIYSGEMIGTGELNIRDSDNRIGEIAYIVNPDYWGNGIATEVASLLNDFGFRQLKLHRIFATCDPRNIASAKVLEKAGMSKEGKIRENMLIKDGWRDSLLFSILEYEWEK